jgi:hypothetical protein
MTTVKEATGVTKSQAVLNVTRRSIRRRIVFREEAHIVTGYGTCLALGASAFT